jgi:hypothetical protein
MLNTLNNWITTLPLDIKISWDVGIKDTFFQTHDPYSSKKKV